MAFHVTGDSLDLIYHDGGEFMRYSSSIADRSLSDLASRSAVSLTIPGFASRALCFFNIALSSNYPLAVHPTDIDGNVIATSSLCSLVLPIITNSSGTIYISLSDYTGTNNVSINTFGWYFPAGM